MRSMNRVFTQQQSFVRGNRLPRKIFFSAHSVLSREELRLCSGEVDDDCLASRWDIIPNLKMVNMYTERQFISKINHVYKDYGQENMKQKKTINT